MLNNINMKDSILLKIFGGTGGLRSAERIEEDAEVWTLSGLCIRVVISVTMQEISSV